MTGKRQLYQLLLVELTPEQIVLAKRANGARKQITHAVLCGPYGQKFGTEKQCLKYYQVWKEIFPTIFHWAKKKNRHDITDFNSTEDLVYRLIDAE